MTAPAAGPGLRPRSDWPWSASRLTMAAVATAIAAGVAATPTAAAGSSCRAPEGASAVHRSKTVVVYRRARTPRSASYWACLRSSGRRTVLPGSRTGRTLSSFRSAGRYLAFFVEEIDARSMTGTVGVRVFDTRAGRAVRGIALFISPSDPDRTRLRNLILTARGTAAWREVGRVDRIAARDLRGRRRILDSGPRGSIGDLALRRGAVAQWRNGGEVKRRDINRLGR